MSSSVSAPANRAPLSRRGSGALLAIQLLLDVHDDVRVLRAVEAFVAKRREAVLVRPTPGCHGSRTLCRDVLYSAGLPDRPPRRSCAWIPEARVAPLLRRKRVRELWVLRAHAIESWSSLGYIAAHAQARLYLVIHAPDPGRHQVEGLRFLGYPVAAPREIRLSMDRVALALCIMPAEGWSLGAAQRVLWLPALPI